MFEIKFNSCIGKIYTSGWISHDTFVDNSDLKTQKATSRLLNFFWIIKKQHLIYD